MRYAVRHLTAYETPEPVAVCHNIARVSPRATERQRVVRHALNIDPEASCRSSFTDSFGNLATTFSHSSGYAALRVVADSTIEVTPPPPIDRAASPAWEQIATAVDLPPAVEQFRYDSPYIRRSVDFGGYARLSFTPGRPVLEALHDLTVRINDDFSYQKNATSISTPIERVFTERAGVCQDFAHLQIAMLRTLGLPARYVSGYIRNDPPPGKEQLVGASESHAWLACYAGEGCDIGGQPGWADTDPTNRKFLTDEYLTLAYGRDFSDVSPVKGMYIGGSRHKMTISVSVRALEGS